MCGRYASSHPLADVVEWLSVAEVRTEELPPSYNVAPTDAVYAVVERGGRRVLGALSWGLTPPGAPWRSGAPRPINARAETLSTRPAFREAFARRRCLLPADGFYEWRARPGRPGQAWFFRPRGGGMLAFAGLWAGAPGAQGQGTCTIVTTRANPVVGALHDRMPLILAEGQWEAWLDPDTEGSQLSPLLVPAPASLLESHPVARLVNSVRNNGPELVRPVAPEDPPPALFP